MPDLREVYERQAADAAAGLDPAREHWSGPPEMVERIAALLGTGPGHLVVDLGCGLGGPARRLAGHARCRVVGVDLLPAVVAGARRATGARCRVGFVAASVEWLPLRSGVADQAWCLGVVAHVRSLDRLAEEAWRVLRPGGALAVTEAFWTGVRPPEFAASAPQPWRPLREEEVVEAVARAGFRNVGLLPWPGEGLGNEPADPALARDFARGTMASRLVTARKA